MLKSKAKLESTKAEKTHQPPIDNDPHKNRIKALFPRLVGRLLKDNTKNIDIIQKELHQNNLIPLLHALYYDECFDVNERFGSGSSYLHEAVRLNVIPLVVLLLERGAKLSKNHHQQTPVELAREIGAFRCSQVFDEHFSKKPIGGDVQSILDYEIAQRNIEGIREILLSRKAHISRNTLIIALKSKDPELFKLIADSYKETLPAYLINMAVEQHDEPNLSYLLKKGVRTNHLDAKRQTALHTACSQGDFFCALELIKAGAQLEARDNKGNTPFACAVLAQQIDICSLLHGAGVNIVPKNHRNQTPLALLRELMSFGSDTDEEPEKCRRQRLERLLMRWIDKLQYESQLKRKLIAQPELELSMLTRIVRNEAPSANFQVSKLNTNYDRDTWLNRAKKSQHINKSRPSSSLPTPVAQVAPQQTQAPTNSPVAAGARTYLPKSSKHSHGQRARHQGLPHRQEAPKGAPQEVKTGRRATRAKK